MSRAGSARDRLNKPIDTCRAVFWPANQVTNSSEMADDESQREAEASGVDNETSSPRGDEEEMPPVDEIEAGQRTSRWFERIENKVDQNRARSVNNREMLGQIDIRTVWIARILVGMLATILGGLIMQTYFIP